MIEVFDNFLEEDQFKDLERRFCVDFVEWHFNPHVVFPWDEDNLDNFQFVNTLYVHGSPQNEHYNSVLPLFDKLEIQFPLRAKLNLQTRTPEIVKRSFHADMKDVLDDDFPYKTAIYYFNTNDGYTEFETGEIVESVANRVVIFDGNQMHRGTTCTNSKTRVVLNINYI